MRAKFKRKHPASKLPAKARFRVEPPWKVTRAIIGHWVIVGWLDAPPSVGLCIAFEDGLPTVWWPNNESHGWTCENGTCNLDSKAQIISPHVEVAFGHDSPVGSFRLPSRFLHLGFLPRGAADKPVVPELAAVVVDCVC
jgi:hypothetical protein